MIHVSKPPIFGIDQQLFKVSRKCFLLGIYDSTHSTLVFIACCWWSCPVFIGHLFFWLSTALITTSRSHHWPRYNFYLTIIYHYVTIIDHHSALSSILRLSHEPLDNHHIPIRPAIRKQSHTLFAVPSSHRDAILGAWGLGVEEEIGSLDQRIDSSNEGLANDCHGLPWHFLRVGWWWLIGWLRLVF